MKSIKARSRDENNLSRVARAGDMISIDYFTILDVCILIKSRTSIDGLRETINNFFSLSTGENERLSRKRVVDFEPLH